VPAPKSIEPPNFSWVEPQLAGMAWPGTGQVLDASLHWLDDEGVDVIISLTETPPDPIAVAAQGFDLFHFPVVDFTAPTLDQMNTVVFIIAGVIAADESVVVHDTAGFGRCGTMLAAWFVAQGMTADDAIAHVRALRPGSIETASQIDAIHDYEDLLNGIDD
jgi:atypical dual specificity phosphatase